MDLHIPDETAFLHAHYHFRRAYERSQGRCYCHKPLDAERIRDKRLCAECESKDAERIRRLNAGGLHG